MADLKFGDRTYRKMGGTWMMHPTTLPGFIAVAEESTSVMLDEIDRLRAEVERLRDEMSTMHRTVVHDCCVQVQSERALADQLADALGNEWPRISNKPYSDVSTAHAATTAALSAWQEARRG